jgi:uncharacterized membrane protein
MNTPYPLLTTLHILGVIVWVGGMFFAYVILRPATTALQPADRLLLWSNCLQTFLRWVWAALLTILLSGHLLLVEMGGLVSAPIYVKLMMMTGWVMTAIFCFLFFFPYPALRAAVGREEWATASGSLSLIRRCVAINLLLGLATVVATAFKAL